MIKFVDPKTLKSHPNNPRIIKDAKFKKLVQSIKDFPEMMHIRPIVANKDLVVIGGNQRLKAVLELEWTQVEVFIADLTPEEQAEFVIKDNVSGGDWDYSALEKDWKQADLSGWGLDIPIKIEDIEKVSRGTDKEFEQSFNNIKDADVPHPIVPQFMETHECFILIVENEIDEQFIRNIFKLNGNFQSADGKVRKSNVIKVSDVRAYTHNSPE